MTAHAEASPPPRDVSPGEAGRDGERQSARPLRRDEKVTVALLGLPTFALALSITTVTSYLPVQAQSLLGSSTFVIGLIIGTQGLIALVVPLAAGSWSDRLHTRWGGRLPFLLAAAPVGALALVGMGFVGSTGALLATTVVFFVAYFVAYEPYRALYPDAVPAEIAGRAQSAQAVFRGVGTGGALLGGGLLVGLAAPAPFIAAAVLLVGTALVFSAALLRRGLPRQERGGRTPREQAGHIAGLVRTRPALRAFLAANALWELSLGALQTFVILYLVRGLGFGTGSAALLVGGFALFVLLGAVLGGRLGDRLGTVRVLRLALPAYGVGLLVPFLTSSPWIVGAVGPFVAIGGGLIMALPYAVLQPLMPADDHGALSGLYTLSRGVGTAGGPLLAGVAITVLREPLAGTEGFAAMWLVCAAGILASLVPLRRLHRQVGDDPAR